MALRKNHSKLVQKSTDRVCLHDPDLHKLGSYSMETQTRLLLQGFDRNLSDMRLLRCDIDGLCIQRIGLVSSNKRTNTVRWKQFNTMSHAEQHPRPVMGAAASFHCHDRRRTICKELRNLRSLQFTALEFACLGVDGVQLEHILGDVHADNRKRGFMEHRDL